MDIPVIFSTFIEATFDLFSNFETTDNINETNSLAIYSKELLFNIYQFRNVTVTVSSHLTSIYDKILIH